MHNHEAILLCRNANPIKREDCELPPFFKRVAENFWIVVAIMVFGGLCCLSAGLYSIIQQGRQESKAVMTQQRNDSLGIDEIRYSRFRRPYESRVAARLRFLNERIELAWAKKDNSDGIRDRIEEMKAMRNVAQAQFGRMQEAMPEDWKEIQRKMEPILKSLEKKKL